tara:strand:- start:649 stop:1173 length:525 start_codon:yes stop_codon:yes gene_type:complete
MAKNYGFRSWYYFRMGWSTYFAFIFGAMNTLTVTYFLAINNYPLLKSVFPSFEIYVLITIFIGIPLLTLIGYSHFKRTQARRSEVDILMETQPYVVRSLVNSEMLLNINLKILTSLKAISGEKLSATQKEELDGLEKELLDFVNKRRFTGDKSGSAVKDKDFFLNLDKKSWTDT